MFLSLGNAPQFWWIEVRYKSRGKEEEYQLIFLTNSHADIRIEMSILKHTHLAAGTFKEDTIHHARSILDKAMKLSACIPEHSLCRAHLWTLSTERMCKITGRFRDLRRDAEIGCLSNTQVTKDRMSGGLLPSFFIFGFYFIFYFFQADTDSTHISGSFVCALHWSNTRSRQILSLTLSLVIFLDVESPSPQQGPRTTSLQNITMESQENVPRVNKHSVYCYLISDRDLCGFLTPEGVNSPETGWTVGKSQADVRWRHWYLHNGLFLLLL